MEFGDFNNGVCYVMMITTAESNQDTELITQHYSSSQIMSTTSDLGPCNSECTCSSIDKN